jgi:hypothetical protein
MQKRHLEVILRHLQIKAERIEIYQNAYLAINWLSQRISNFDKCLMLYCCK